MITYGGAQDTASRDQIDNEPEASNDQFCELHVMLGLLCQRISFSNVADFLNETDSNVGHVMKTVLEIHDCLKLYTYHWHWDSGTIFQVVPLTKVSDGTSWINQ